MGQLSPQAAQYYQILTSFSEAINLYQQRRYRGPPTTKTYVERIIPLGPASPEKVEDQPDLQIPDSDFFTMANQGRSNGMSESMAMDKNGPAQIFDVGGDLELGDDVLNPDWGDIMSILEIFTSEVQDPTAQ